MTTATNAWIDAPEAARMLGVSRATLYAYTSRGFIRSQPSAGSSRERRYSREDVERRQSQTEARRAPDKATARALQWGLPVLESSIALIDGRNLYYRGLDAMVLARSQSLEDVAALIWTGHMEPLAVPRTRERAAGPRSPLPFIARAESLLADAGARDPLAWDLRRSAVAATGLRILRILAGAAVNGPPGSGPTHLLLSRHWRVVSRGSDIVRAALVACADHELNVSSFTARSVASAGSHPYAVVLAGLAALEGPRHGGASARVEAMLESLRPARPLRAALAARMRRGDAIDGFGHPLYRGGDPRARLLLDLLGDRYARSRQYRFVMDCARAGAAVTGDHPNLDFALAAVARVLELPAGAPLMLFAIGRSVGWIGHAIEQYDTGQLIRPRAKYVGLPPAPSASA